MNFKASQVFQTVTVINQSETKNILTLQNSKDRYRNLEYLNCLVFRGWEGERKAHENDNDIWRFSVLPKIM